MTFLNPRYEGLLRLDSITCIIDAVGIFADGDNERLNLLKLRQIGFADMVVLNKTDLVEPEHIEVIREWIGHHMNRIRIVEATQCDVPLEVLLAVGRFDPVNAVSRRGDSGADEHEHHHEHGNLGAMFQTWSYESDKPFSLKALRKMVQRELPASIYRCKGIVYATDCPSKRYALQIVGRRTEISELDEWGKRTPRTQIVAIGALGGIDARELSDKFDACLEQF
jgi:G3E family GTPase